MPCVCGIDSVTVLYAGLTTTVCILFLVTCLLVNEFFTEQYDDIGEIKESSSYKAIYESEITPSNNFLVISSSETPFQNPFYTLLIDNQRGYVYEHKDNHATTTGKEDALRSKNTEEKSIHFAHNVDNLDRSNRAVLTIRHKYVNKSVTKNKNATFDKNNTANRQNISNEREYAFEDDTSSESASNTENGKSNKDIKYIYRKEGFTNTSKGVENQNVATSTVCVQIHNLETQTDCCPKTLDACCSAMTFKQIETIMQTDSVLFIDRKEYRNCSTCMSKQFIGKTSVYASTSTPKCFDKCLQVDSGILGTRKAFKSGCTSAIQVKRGEQRIQTDPTIARIKSECHKKSIAAGAVHINSREKCEICQIKRIMEKFDKALEKDNNTRSTSAGTRKIQEHKRIQFSSKGKPVKNITIEQNSKKIATKKLSTQQCSIPTDSTSGSSDVEEETFYVPKVLLKSWRNDPQFRQSITDTEPSTDISTFQPQNYVTDKNFEDKNTSILHKLSQQAESYLDHARKIVNQMKENDPNIVHYRTVKNDILNGYPHSLHTNKIKINECDRKIQKDIKFNPTGAAETLNLQKSQTEVTIKNLIPELNITIQTPNKNLKRSKIRVRTNHSPNKSIEDKLATSSKKAKSDRTYDNVSYKGTDTTGHSTNRVTLIHSNTKISTSKNKLHIDQSSSIISVMRCRSQKGLGTKNSRVTFKDDKKVQNLTKSEYVTTPITQENIVRKPKGNCQATLYPRYNVRSCPSKDSSVKSSPIYSRETICRAGCLKANIYNVTNVIPTQHTKMSENVCCKKRNLAGNVLQAYTTGYGIKCACCPLQSSSIRSSQMYPQYLEKKPTYRSCYQCNLGQTSRKLCRCMKKLDGEDDNFQGRWRI